MLAEGTAVRVGDRPGYVYRLAHASQGRRYWRIDFDSGDVGIYPEGEIIDVDREEWQEALNVVPDAERCDSYYYRRCALRKDHRTVLHRHAEITWTDAAAGTYTREQADTKPPITGIMPW